MFTRKWFLCAVLGFAAGFGFPAPPAAAQNLVTNGSFEAQNVSYVLFDTNGAVFSAGDVTAGDPLAGWTINEGGVQDLGISNAIAAAAGEQWLALSFGDTNTRATVSQDLATTPGETYTIRFAWVCQVNGSSTLTESISIFWDGSEVDTIEFLCGNNPPDPRDWVYAEYEVTATNSTTTLAFKNKGWPQPDPTSNRGLGLDHVSVEKTAPPRIVAFPSDGTLCVMQPLDATLEPQYAIDLGANPAEWLSVPGFSNTFVAGTNTYTFSPPATNADPIAYRIKGVTNPDDVRWDSDFNADSVGLAPSTEPVGAGHPAGTLTRPNPGITGVTVRATSGGLNDQPAELVIPAGNDQPENITYADFDSFIFDPPDDNYRFEWDMSIVSTPATSAGAIVMLRLDGIGLSSPVMIKWGTDGLGNADAVGVVFGEGSGATVFLPYTFGTPMHMVVMIDKSNGLFSVFKDGTAILSNHSVAGLDRVFALTFKGAHGGVDVGVGGTVAIDNFRAIVDL